MMEQKTYIGVGLMGNSGHGEGWAKTWVDAGQ
jgi:hypothetical protein